MDQINLTSLDVRYLRRALNDGIKWRDSLAGVYNEAAPERKESQEISKKYNELLEKIK